MKQHDYKHLDKDSKLTLEIDLRQVAEHVESLNYGVHRFLSHLVDVRRECLDARALDIEKRGHLDIANGMRRESDQLAEGIAALLARGLF